MARRRVEPLREVLGPLEADVMEVIWGLDEVTVRDVYAELRKSRRIAYTTVMTTMSRLSDKGLLRRSETQPAHRYSPLVSREQYARSTVKSVVDWLVNQFGHPAVSYFLDRVEKDDQRVIETLREAIRQREADEEK